ncbi:Crp/Fnr family transcriptional regulator [Variovorax paradoxus]|jgi:CRP/FNR family transcriptional regulator, cyclic AMP receptor protein|uniref:Crp/Fnr family transcriptional regulator n=1 Tax=Variovorax paradoxus TaxID=34073 RepID=UPI0027D8E2D9|nr:Crp/Fnr family transcriptional regulator [Variovorax paradoxus]
MIDAREPLEDAALMERALRLTHGFARWPASAMSRLLANAHLDRRTRGEMVSIELGAPETFAIVSGYLVVGHIPPGGSRTPVALLGPGYIAGFTRAIDQEESEEKEADRVVYDFCALNDVTVVRMPTLLVQKILDEDPTLWKGMAKMLMKQHRIVLDSLLSQGVGSFPRRLAATIERLAVLYGSNDGQGISLRLRLTQEDLAALLQVTRQTVNKALGVLVAGGALSLSQNTITVLDLGALRRLADSQ